MKPTQPTIAAYDQYADIYDQETIEFWQKFPREFIERFVAALPGKKVLDLGSGPGRDAMLLRDAGLNVTCTDGSAEMVKRTADLGFPSTQADFTTLELPAGSYDGVWAYTSLLHIDSIRMLDVLRRIQSWLVPTGAFAIGMIEGDWAGDVERESMPGAKRYFRHYVEQELTALVKQSGFELEYQGRYQPNTKTYINQIYSKI